MVPTYNLPGLASLKFSGDTLAGIYLGNIKKWNDPALKKDNPGVNLPSEDITVVHRSDGSGTTFVWTDYLSKVSPEWKSKVGANTSVNWPVGLGGKGNEGVAGLGETDAKFHRLRRIDLRGPKQNGVRFRQERGRQLRQGRRQLRSPKRPLAPPRNMPADFRVSITNAPGKNAYPISSFTWMLIPDKIDNATKKKSITDFLQWMMTTGQGDATGMSYAPLPKPIIAKEQKQIALIK